MLNKVVGRSHDAQLGCPGHATTLARSSATHEVPGLTSNEQRARRHDLDRIFDHRDDRLRTHESSLPRVRWPVMPGQAILQPGVAELVERADCTRDIAVASIFEEAHEAYGGSPAYGELNECKARHPGHRIHKAGCGPKREPDRDTGRQPCSEADRGSPHETDHKSEGKPEAEPDKEPGHETYRPDGDT